MLVMVQESTPRFEKPWSVKVKYGQISRVPVDLYLLGPAHCCVVRSSLGMSQGEDE